MWEQRKLDYSSAPGSTKLCSRNCAIPTILRKLQSELTIKILAVLRKIKKNETNKLIKVTKTEYDKSEIADNSSEPRHTWRAINNMAGR